MVALVGTSTIWKKMKKLGRSFDLATEMKHYKKMKRFTSLFI
jgi:hypothetical protein